MFSSLRLFRQRKYSLILLVGLVLAALSLSSGVIQAQEATSPAACAVTPNLLGGQGFSVSGQGFSVSEQGFSVSGQGFSVSGQGFSVSGQGFSVSGQSVTFDPLAVAKEIRDNPVPKGKWVSDRLNFFVNHLGFNTDPTAIIIIDEFTGSDHPHGGLVQQVVDDSLKALPSDLKIESFQIDINTITPKYNADAIANAISAKVNELQTRAVNPYHRFVLNMSFGLISCTDPGPIINGTQLPAFDFNQATQVVAANNLPNTTLAVKPILECVDHVSNDEDNHYGGKSRVTDRRHDDNTNGGYIAYFGYQNDNDQLVKIPVGTNNKFSTTTNVYQPAQFEPGRQKFVFAVKFSGSNLVWSLKGPDGQIRTVTASKYSTPCATPPPAPTQAITPVVECVANVSSGVYEAHFGYKNPNAVGTNIPLGYKNKFTPSSADGKQVTTFVPGEHKDVFKVSFDGSNLSWTLGSITVTANSSTVACPIQQGFGINDYLTQNLGVPNNLVSAYYDHLADSVTTDEFQKLRMLLGQYLSDSADPSKNFTAVTVASSGNLRPWLGNAPLAPASWKETIAVGATLADTNTIWQFSQDANVVAPGVGYPMPDGTFSAGTSFAAPAFSVLVGMCSTVPSALHFDGTNPPLALDAAGNKVLNNSIIGLTNLTPFSCAPNSNPTISPIGDQTNKEGDTVSLQVTAVDPENNTLTYDVSGLPAGLTFSKTTGLISGKIAANSAGTYVVTVKVSDNGTPQGNAEPVSFNWVVTAAQTGVKIDIRPYSPSNRINLSSPGFVAVAIFGSSTFDASLIDPATVTLAGAPAVKVFGKFYTLTFDINRDGKIDRILWFEAKKLQLTATSTEAVLLGKTVFGLAFRGVDKVQIVTPSAPHLVSPATNTIVKNWLVKLVWSDDQGWEDGDNVCYVVQISKSSSFSSVVQGAIVVDRQSVTTIPLTNGTYYWRVAYSDCAINTVSPWSDAWSFKVQR